MAAIYLDPGEPAAGPALRLIDASELYLEVLLADADVTRQRIGQPATVTIDGLTGRSFDGAVRHIAPAASVSGSARTFVVQVALADTAGLLAGMQGQVQIREEQ